MEKLLGILRQANDRTPHASRVDQRQFPGSSEMGCIMHWADIIAERRAAEAAAHGELSKLPGEGKPLDLSVDLLVPPEVRAIMRTLKHAGLTPPEIAAIKAIANLEKELAALPRSARAETARALVARIAFIREATASHYLP